MKKLLLTLLASANLLAASLINYSIYKHDTHTDVLLSFNEPYSAGLKIIRAKDYQAVILPGLISSEKRAINLGLPYVSELLIYPFEKNSETSTVLEFKTLKDIQITPAITKDDGFALRIRISPTEASTEAKSALDEPSKSAKSIEFASDDQMGLAWLKMMIALVVIIAVLLLLKAYLKRKRFRPTEASHFASGAVILCDKSLDDNNRFIVLEYEGAKYKLIIGQGNIWLNAPSTPTTASENFEQYFLENQQRLNNLIRQKNMDSYKEKISNKKDNL